MKRENPLSAMEIAAIIKACGESGVSVLKFAGLYIAFGTRRGETLSSQQETAPQPPAPEAAISENQRTVSKEALIAEEIAQREEQLSFMQIEAPYEAEKLLMAGELESDDGTDDEET